MPLKILQEEGFEVTLNWYNPNIQPASEYEKRYNSLIHYSTINNLNLIAVSKFDSTESLNEVNCQLCYSIRLQQTAKIAAEQGLAYFTTTLLVSPYQKHELITDIGNKAATKYQTDFVYHDFRPHFRVGQAKAKELGLYRQKYCGCFVVKS